MKTITMYELLGLVKDGKAPKKVKYNKEVLYYDERFKDYFNDEDMHSLFAGVNTILDDEVEILEEEKKIPDDLYCLFTIDYNDDLHEIIKKSNINFRNISEKLDEIIDYLKSKGE